MKHFLVFGNHPRLSLAEYKAMTGQKEKPLTIGNGALIDATEWNGATLMDASGGIVKLGDIVGSMPFDALTIETVMSFMNTEGRSDILPFGWTVIGGTKSKQLRANKLPLQLKRALKEHGIRSRWVTGKGNESLSPAAVAKLELTTKGYDVVIFLDQETAHIGFTTHVQNADSWSQRDYGRPVRDDEAGMLPPKLARMMVNLAIGADTSKKNILLDPFCGNGTILMEAALRSHNLELIGSDISEKQMQSTETNINWLMEQDLLPSKAQSRFRFIASDVRKLGAELKPALIDLVVTEGHLGTPLKGREPQSMLDTLKQESESLWKETLSSLHPLLKKDAIIVCIWPSYKTDKGLARVSLDQEIESLGYKIINPLESWDESNDPLIYSRPGQRIARRIILMQKANQ